MTSLTKNQQPSTKTFFSLKTTRPAESFDRLNCSLVLTAPKLCSFEPRAIRLSWLEPLDLDRL